MMPGWTETKENRPPCWFEYGDKIILFRSERDQTVWSPATDLNQAAEAVRAIVGSDVDKKGSFVGRCYNAIPYSETAEYDILVAGPRAWCEALVAVGGAILAAWRAMNSKN